MSSAAGVKGLTAEVDPGKITNLLETDTERSHAT